MLRLLRKLPFTLAMIALLIGAAFWSGTHAGPLQPQWRGGVSFTLQHLADFQWQRLSTAALLTSGGATFYLSLLMLAACVGWAEWTVGTWKTAATFWGVHVATVLILAAIASLALASLDSMRAELLIEAQDVGPSAGYYACLGLALGHRRSACRWPLAVALVLLFLVARWTWSLTWIPDHGRQMAADSAHLIAFALGIGIALLSHPGRGRRRT